MSNLSKRVGKLEEIQNPCVTRIVWVEEYRTKLAQDAWIERYLQENNVPNDVEIQFYRWKPMEDY